MATKQFCDLCGAETTGVKSGTIEGIEDADETGGGTVSDTWDACSKCYRLWREWMKQRTNDGTDSDRPRRRVRR
jgi:hypothetical protein